MYMDQVFIEDTGKEENPLELVIIERSNNE